MANQTPSTRPNLKKTLVIAENVLLYTLIVGAIGFYVGTQYQTNQVAQTKAAVQDALKAVATPAPVAAASKN